MSGTYARAGHDAVSGSDGGTNPTSLPDGVCALAVNRSFRNSKHRNRPAFLYCKINFATDDLREYFETHAIKGVFEYKMTLANTSSCMIVFVGARIIAFYMAGNTGSAVQLFDGMSQLTDCAAFVQVADRAYFQDGDGTKLGWDGVNPVYKLGDGLDDMPTFIAMAECQGRVVGFTEGGYAIISDHVYSKGVGTTTGAEVWSEYQYVEDIGSIPLPSALGRFVGACNIRQDGVLNAEGPLLVLGTGGAYTLNLIGVRLQWNIATIQRQYPMIAGGCSADTIVSAGSDVWWQSSDGSLRSFKYEESDSEKEWGGQSFSNEVQNFTDMSIYPALSHASSVVFGNRMLTSVAIRTAPDVEGNQHRYGLGIVSMDFDRGTVTTPDQNYSWDGIWTGIKPTKFCKCGVFCYALSFDGKRNEVFQLTENTEIDDIDCDGKPRRIESFYRTGFMFWDRDKNQPRTIKRILSVSINALGQSSDSLVCSYTGYSGRRQRLSQALMQGRQEAVVPMYSARKFISGPIHFSGNQQDPMDVAFQIELEMKGCVQIDALNAKASIEEEKISATSQLTEASDCGTMEPYEIFNYTLCK